jgi:hypothetical protein
MSRIHGECPDSDLSDWLVVPADVLLRQEPDEEEDEEEDDHKKEEDDEDDDEETDDGYSESMCSYFLTVLSGAEFD